MNRLRVLGLATTLLVSGGALAVDPDAATLEAAREAFGRGDLVAAMTAYREAAAAGSAEAQVGLARLLDYAEEDAEAAAWYRAAADQGDPDGLAGLAGMYAKGEGVGRDAARAVALFEQAAGAGHVPSMVVLAAAREEGGMGLAADPREAGRWLLEAAEHGDLRSMERIAEAYAQGSLGLPRDADAASRWQRSVQSARAARGQRED